MAEENSQQAPTAAPVTGQNGNVILHTEKITKVFPGTTALDQVDFNCYRGKVNVLIGENGRANRP
jgi:erythritol transport system ATP-binding protein